MNFSAGQITSIIVIIATLAIAVINLIRDRASRKGAKAEAARLDAELTANRETNEKVANLFTETQRSLNAALGDIRVELTRISTRLEGPSQERKP